MNDIDLKTKEIISNSTKEDISRPHLKQPENNQLSFLKQILLGLFILIGGIAYLFNLPSGTLFLVSGIFLLIISLCEFFSREVDLEPISMIIGILCLVKGITSLFGITLTFFPIFFIIIGLILVVRTLQRRVII